LRDDLLPLCLTRLGRAVYESDCLQGTFSKERMQDGASPQPLGTLDLRQVASITSNRPQHLALLIKDTLQRALHIVVRLLAESLVVVLLMAFGWLGMTTLGSDSVQAMRYPIYVAGCPLADTRLEKGSAVGGCSKEGVSHPITSRQPGGGLVEHAHGAERHRDDRVPPRTSENAPSAHSGE
jgi:hypothetical protein